MSEREKYLNLSNVVGGFSDSTVFVGYTESEGDLGKYRDLLERRHEYAQFFYDFYSKSSAHYKAYSADPFPFGSDKWGEEVFWADFGYFGKSDLSTKSNDLMHDNETGETYLRIYKESCINLILAKFRSAELLRFYDEVDENADKSSYPMRKLICARALDLRKRIDDFALFTYQGNRYVAAKSALKHDLEVESGDYLNAVPFQHALSLSDIDSTRLIEKVRHQIAYKKRYSNSSNVKKDDNVIRIAAFGAFSDEGELNIEALAKAGFFKAQDGSNIQYDVKVTYFKLKKLGYASIDFEEDDEGIPDSDRIIGNLYDIDFLRRVSAKYDITCLLDMGCFYCDTSRNQKSQNSVSYDVEDCIRAIEVQKNGDKIDGIDTIAYINLYKSYLRWIEYTYYGEAHQYEFDPRLFAVLSKLQTEAEPGHSFFTYLSRDRGKIFENQLKYDNLCCIEYYKGRCLSVYDWRKTDYKNEIDDQKKYLIALCNSDYKDKAVFRFWKILKSLDDYFYSKRFTKPIKEDYTSKPAGIASVDIDFVRFCDDTSIELDYSRLRDEKAILYSVITKNESAYPQKFKDAANTFVDALIKIVFVPSCYDPCATPFGRLVLSNAIVADALLVEHLVLSHMIKSQRIKCRFEYNTLIDSAERTEMMKLEQAYTREKDDPRVAVCRHTVNNVLVDAINTVNSMDYSANFDYVRSRLSEVVQGYNGDKDPGEILKKLGAVCDSLGFGNCTIAYCCK